MRLLLRSILTLCLCSLTGQFGRQSEPPEKVNADLIVPGQSVGPLKLEDTRERAEELFPYKPNMDQKWREAFDCGTTMNCLDMRKSKMLGNVFIRFKEDKVFQIDSGTSSFRTQEGITIFSSPQEVRRKYPGLRAYIISTGFSEASGGRPLIYWIDAKRGIGLGFAYSRRDLKPYLTWIIVFKPHAEVCPEYGPLSTSDKRELPAYSLRFPVK